jgi:hypothetical protein
MATTYDSKRLQEMYVLVQVGPPSSQNGAVNIQLIRGIPLLL